jgi:hypothetical protein
MTHPSEYVGRAHRHEVVYDEEETAWFIVSSTVDQLDRYRSSGVGDSNWTNGGLVGGSP